MTQSDLTAVLRNSIKHHIMTVAWNQFRAWQGQKTFGDCLKSAWSRYNWTKSQDAATSAVNATRKRIKVRAKDITAGMMLTSGAKVIRGGFDTVNTPNNKTNLILEWPGGKQKMHTWNKTTSIGVYGS